MEKKLIRKKEKAAQTLSKACNDLATFYFSQARYNDALDEFKNEAGICKELGQMQTLQWGICNRMMGEVFMLMGEFDKALECEERHLAVARDLNNLLEEQRAIATLGRIYLLKGQSTTDNSVTTNLLTEAEKAFMQSLVLCQRLNGEINELELMDMRACLLLNIGVVQEHLGHLDKAIDFFEKATSMSADYFLYEILHECYMNISLHYANKKKDFQMALSFLNKALNVASKLENRKERVVKKCETLSAKADIFCRMSDYRSAKQNLITAWKLKTPDEEKRTNIESNLKVVVKICEIEELLDSTDSNNHGELKKHYEILGDGACNFRNYLSAVDYYLKSLDHAKRAGDYGKSLVPIYVSIYQTYKDMGMYQEALEYYYKEHEIIKDDPKEAYTTLYNMAEALFHAKKPYEQIKKTCHDARDVAKQLNNKKYEKRILKNLYKYEQYYFEHDKMEDTKYELLALGGDCDELSDDEQSTGDESPNIGDDVCLDDLTDEETAEVNNPGRRGNSFAVRKNAKGETQLHVACISGNVSLVERLLGQGHPANARDHAGWTPLHEACIHGHVAAARALLHRGANIDDRGGARCDGITPLYEAACNGNLEVVELLLEKGAMPSLKTDFGGTPLTALHKWKTGKILTKDKEVLYYNICNKIHNLLDKTMPDKYRTSIKSIQIESLPSTSKISNESLSLKEYRSIDIPEVEIKTRKTKSALSQPNEVDDDWLDDIRTNRSKKRKLSDPLTTLPNRSFVDSLKSSIVPNFNDMTRKKSCISDIEIISDPDHLSSISGSDNETNIQDKEQNLSSRRTYSENINCAYINDNCNIVQSMNPNILLPMNATKPISILQSKNGWPKQTQIPGAVKVNIEDKMLLIPLKMDTINNLTISWLVEDVKSRYYKYVYSPSEEIQQVVGRSHTTRRLALGSSTLSSTQIRPLFRALTHQTHITAIMIADNNIQDDGMKYLADSIYTMKHLTVLDVSNNNITGEGVKTLANAFEKASDNCQSLENIDLSGNKISDDGFKAVLTLSRHLKLRILKLNSCGITGNVANEVTKFDMNFDTLETLHMSHNAINQMLVNCMMEALNPNVLCDLELNNINCQGTIVGCISNFMSNAKDLKIQRLSLSDCKLTDTPLKFILRCLDRAKNLQTITFKNNQLTFFSLMRLLQRQPAVPQINLEGCQDIFKYSSDLDIQVWLPTIDFGSCIPIINVTPICKSTEEKKV